MNESYDSSYILESLRSYLEGRDAGAFDGFELSFPQGMNTLDPLLMIRHGTLEATFDEQVLLTKALIVNKKVVVTLYETEIGSFQLNDVNQGFGGFSVFEQYPMALQMLVRTCYLSVLKNLLPPLSDSQRAVMMERKKRREASSQPNGSKQPG